MTELASSYHTPVLYHEVLDALNIKPEGVYVDCTYGGGGHSKGILEKLNENGKLFAFDQDADAEKNVTKDDRIVFIPHNFRYIQRFLRLHKIQQVDGVLADLGVSSYQFDEGTRGFSTRFDGPFDMRMDQRQKLTAKDIVREYTELQLHKMFEQYGEVSNSKTLARHIVEQRKQMTSETIQQFKAMIDPMIKGNPNKYLAQVFQALRIEVNDEIGALKEMLQQLPDVLKPGGRAVILTFHSLEDREVKNFFRKGSFDEVPYNEFSFESEAEIFKIITKKPITANKEELKRNPRSRSAKLRAVERLEDESKSTL